jgi:hypothetical protein
VSGLKVLGCRLRISQRRRERHIAVFFWCHPGPNTFLRGFSILSSLAPHLRPAPLLAVGLLLHPWQASREFESTISRPSPVVSRNAISCRASAGSRTKRLRGKWTNVGFCHGCAPAPQITSPGLLLSHAGTPEDPGPAPLQPLSTARPRLECLGPWQRKLLARQ